MIYPIVKRKKQDQNFLHLETLYESLSKKSLKSRGYLRLGNFFVCFNIIFPSKLFLNNGLSRCGLLTFCPKVFIFSIISIFTEFLAIYVIQNCCF